MPRVVDLTTVIRTGTPVFPTYPQPIVHTWTTVRLHGFYSNVLLIPEHVCTHVDAPAHFIEAGETIDKVPLEKFMGRGVVVDASGLPPRASITAELIEKQLNQLGVDVGPGWVVLFYTGYDAKAGTPEWFEHPGLDESAARFLAEKRVNAVGIDAPSIDHDPFPAHRVLLSRGIPIYENLTNLKLLLGRPGFQFIGLPLKIEKGSASPVRAVAVIGD